MMKPIEKFSFQYIKEEYELLDYIYPVAQEYAPDFDYDEDTGKTFMAMSQAPDAFKVRYNLGRLKGKFTVEGYMKNKELQDLLEALELDAEKFWYLLLFCYDYSWGKCIEGIELKEFPKEQIEKFTGAIYENYKGSGLLGINFAEPVSITLKVGRKNIVVDNKTAILCIAKFCADGLENTDFEKMGSGYYIDISRSHAESFSVLAYYFSQMLIAAFNHQDHIKTKRKQGANLSDKEKMVISHTLYLTGIVSNESVIYDNSYLKSILKQYKDKEVNTLNPFY